jgi:pre-rRNA-processing protein TSR3
MVSSSMVNELPPLYVWHLHECDPHKCTSIKLKKHGFVKFIPSLKYANKSSIVLNPLSNKVLSVTDKSMVEKWGLVVIDCSWKDTTILDKFKNINMGRRLPLFFAANPTNYAKPYILSSVEAFASALIIIGKLNLAVRLLSLFKWGETFLSLNKLLIDSYMKAKDEFEIRRIEEEFYRHYVIK